MLQDSYKFRNSGPYTRILLTMRAYNTGLFGRQTKKDLPLDFVAQEIDRCPSETQRIVEDLEKDGLLRVYELLENPANMMVSAYSFDGRRLI
jgi:hypothetical protein